MSCFDHIAFAARTDVGKRRKNNEDAFGTFPDAGIFCVADGMGGGDDGEIASAAVIKGVEDAAKLCSSPMDGGYAAADVAEVLETGLSKASEWMFTRSAEKHLSGCGSTFVGVVLDATHPDSALAVHAGDSRLYLLHGRSIRQITRDHSAAELMGAKDESKINPMFRSMVMNAVGIKPKVDVETTPFKVSAGDRILICSDGLSRMVPDRKIASISREHADIGEAADALIAAALEAGGIDNVTVVLVEFGELPEPVAPQQLPDPAAGFVNDEKETTDPTDATDALTEAPDCSTQDEAQTIQTMQTVQPTVSRPRIGVTRRISLNAPRAERPDSRIRMAVIVGVAVLVFAVIVVACLVRGAAKKDVPPSDATLAPARSANQDVAPPAEDAESGAKTLEGLLVEEAEKRAADLGAGLAPADSETSSSATPVDEPPSAVPVAVEPPSAGPLPVAQPVVGSPAVAKSTPAVTDALPASPPVAAPEKPTAAERIAEACDSANANVQRFVSVVKRLFPEGPPTEFINQAEIFAKNARYRAKWTERDAGNAFVDLQIMLRAAKAAQTAMLSRSLTPQESAWAEAWDRVVDGDLKDADVQEACVYLILNANEVRTP